MAYDDSLARERMVATQIAARGISDDRVLGAFRRVPRQAFVSDDLKALAYADEPLPIGSGQTISQPYIVAYMTERLGLAPTDRVLEVGTGSGYQTAILAELVREVWTIEVIAALAARAQATLGARGYGNIRFKVGDGSHGWPEGAPYQAIMVTAAPRTIPAELRAQLEDGGRMILPVGVEYQELILVRKEGTVFKEMRLLPVRFVPLISTH